jgi:hypothetical protein
MDKTEVNGEKSHGLENGIQNSAGGIPLEERPKAYNWKTTNDRGYTINEAPSWRNRPMKVIGVGAGI